MPITTILSYPPTMMEFQLHWQQVNDSLIASGGTELLLPGGYGLAQFTADRDAIVDALSGLENLENDYELGLDDRDSERDNIRDRLINFRKTCNSLFPGSRYLRAMPKTPQDAAAEGIFLSRLDDMDSLWGKINADTTIPGFTPPLVLRGNYTHTGFQSDLADLRSTYQALASAERELKLARGDRDKMLEAAYERMKQYRARIEAEFEETDPLRMTMPDLTASSGSTPDAVNASGEWDDTLMVYRITWNESSEPNLTEYSIRMTVGPTYDSQNDTTIGTVLPGQTTFETVDGLANPGDTASYKVYVVLDTQNEAGSNTLTFTRP